MYAQRMMVRAPHPPPPAAKENKTELSTDAPCSALMMLRRSIVALSKPAVQTGRTIVRDPRKARSKAPAPASASATPQQTQQQPPQQYQAPKPLPFAPNDQNQQAMGLGSYVLAGFGVSMGFAFVGALFGFGA